MHSTLSVSLLCLMPDNFLSGGESFTLMGSTPTNCDEAKSWGGGQGRGIGFSSQVLSP